MTIFHILSLLLALAGAFLISFAGSWAFGVIGGLLGFIVGAFVGCICGYVLVAAILHWSTRDVRSKTTEELRELILSGKTFTPNFVLLELASRGEDIEIYLPRILDMLVTENPDIRRLWWVALVSAFPEQADRLPDYRPAAPLETCRKVVGDIRPLIASHRS
jgi:hypothetical protein